MQGQLRVTITTTIDYSELSQIDQLVLLDHMKYMFERAWTQRIVEEIQKAKDEILLKGDQK
jgi:hypothetical protein